MKVYVPLMIVKMIVASNEECTWTDTNCYSENFTVLATYTVPSNINTEETAAILSIPFLNVDNNLV